MTLHHKSRSRRGRPRRTPAQRAEQRAQLVDRAIEAIRASGADVSMDELAERMRVSKPVIYDAFGGREGLADAIAVVTESRIESQLLSDLLKSDTIDIHVVVHEIIDALITFIETEDELYRFFVRATRGTGRGFLDNGLVRVLRERLGLLLKLLEAPVDPPELTILADGVYGFVFASIESWREGGQVSRDALVQRLTDVITAGLRALAGLSTDTPQ